MTKRRPLVCEHLELISGSALEKYQDVIRGLVSRRHGIYALYRKDRLYYVGLAQDLRGRLRAHLRDRHGGSWDHFSAYLTIGDSHIKELESLVLRITRPTGNRQRGKFARSDDLRHRLTRELKASQRRELDDLLGRSRRVVVPRAKRGNLKRNKVNGQSALAQVLAKGQKLQAKFKGRLYRASLRKDGRVRLAGRVYSSPSAAGCAVTKRATNGLTFWKYQRAPGDWVALKELRRQ